MDLVDIRKENNLTQKEAASLIGMPYRTYVRYEEDPSYKDTFKYAVVANGLKAKVLIDEEHGILTIGKIQEIVTPIFKKHGINFCYLFGTYAKGKAKENSDVDLLIDTKITGLAFFKLVEEVRTALRKKVDLVCLDDLTPENPLNNEILKTGVKLL